jgi:Divergent InlB B-repeat domain
MRKSLVAVTVAACLLLICWITPVLAGLPVKFARNSHWGGGSSEVDKITTIVNNRVSSSVRNLMNSRAKYNYGSRTIEEQFLQANVKVLYDDGGDPDHLLVILLSRTSWGVETLRVDVDNDYNVTGVTTGYEATAEDYAQGASWATGTCPDSSKNMVFLTPHLSNDIPTAAASIELAASDANAAGFQAVGIVDSGITKADHLDWMACDNLILLGRVGHGSTNAIHFLSGDSLDLMAADVTNGMSSTDLNDTQIYYNSCQVHNNGDMLDAITNDAGAQVFIGGDVDLSIGPSEDVFNCWLKNMVNQANTGSPSSLDGISNGDGAEDTLTKCEYKHYLNQGQPGGSSDGTGDHGYYGISSDKQYLIAPDPCAPKLGSSSAHFNDLGGIGSVAVTVGDGCTDLWSAESSDSTWLSITSGADYSGSATVSYSVAYEANINRSGTLTIGENTFTVTQSNTQTTEEVHTDTVRTMNWDTYGRYGVLGGRSLTATTTSSSDVNLFLYDFADEADLPADNPTLNTVCTSLTEGTGNEDCTVQGPGNFWVRVTSGSSTDVSYTLTVTYSTTYVSTCDADHLDLCDATECGNLTGDYIWCTDSCISGTSCPPPPCDGDNLDQCDATQCGNLAGDYIWCTDSCLSGTSCPPPPCDGDNLDQCDATECGNLTGDYIWCTDSCLSGTSCPPPPCDGDNLDQCDATECGDLTGDYIWCTDSCLSGTSCPPPPCDGDNLDQCDATECGNLTGDYIWCTDSCLSGTSCPPPPCDGDNLDQCDATQCGNLAGDYIWCTDSCLSGTSCPPPPCDGDNLDQCDATECGNLTGDYLWCTDSCLSGTSCPPPPCDGDNLDQCDATECGNLAGDYLWCTDSCLSGTSCPPPPCDGDNLDQCDATECGNLTGDYIWCTDSCLSGTSCPPPPCDGDNLEQCDATECGNLVGDYTWCTDACVAGNCSVILDVIIYDNGGTGSITSLSQGISCGSGNSGTCSSAFPKGGTVLLTAYPEVGSAFDKWILGCTGSSLTCEVAMDVDKTVMASFKDAPDECNADNLNLCDSEQGCNDAGLNWCNAACQVAKCPVSTIGFWPRMLPAILKGVKHKK